MRLYRFDTLADGRVVTTQIMEVIIPKLHSDPSINLKEEARTGMMTKDTKVMIVNGMRNLYAIDLSAVIGKNTVDAKREGSGKVVKLHRLDRKNVITHLDMRIYNFVQVSKYIYTMNGSMVGKFDRSFLADQHQNPELFTTYASSLQGIV